MVSNSPFEVQILMKMILHEYHKPLCYHSLRSVIKEAVWKLAMEEQRKHCSTQGPMKQVLMYYKFGASRKNKKFNYLFQLKSGIIFNLFMMECFLNSSSGEFSHAVNWKIVNKYHIRELFWNDNFVSETSMCGKNLWDMMTNLRANMICKERCRNSTIITESLRSFENKFGPKVTLEFLNLLKINHLNVFPNLSEIIV
jgi:hypothetical protein